MILICRFFLLTFKYKLTQYNSYNRYDYMAIQLICGGGGGVVVLY